MESFGQRLAESEEEFRKQFDPLSPEYHRGLQQAVPLGGERVPQSMPTMYPENYDPTETSIKIDYGPQYAQVQFHRSIFQNLNKALARLGPIVAAFLSHQDNFKAKNDPNNEKYLKKYQEMVFKEKQNLKNVQNQLLEFIPQLQKIEAKQKLNMDKINAWRIQFQKQKVINKSICTVSKMLATVEDYQKGSNNIEGMINSFTIITNMNKQIVLYGGAFDPLHIGHLKIITLLKSLKGVDKVWVLPCGDRTDKKLLLSKDQRFQVLKNMFEKDQKVFISNEEIQMSKDFEKMIPTYQLLKALHTKYTDLSFSFVVGSDVASRIGSWEMGDRLMKEYQFIIFSRKGYEISQREFPLKSIFIQEQLPQISSSYIKQIIQDKSINKKQQLNEWLPEQVFRFLVNLGMI